MPSDRKPDFSPDLRLPFFLVILSALQYLQSYTLMLVLQTETGFRIPGMFLTEF